VLWNTTSLWGEPPTAARLWHQYFPDSSRAAQYLTIAHSAHGETSDAVLVIEQAWRRHPERSDLAMQTIQMSCYGTTPTREVLNIVASTLNTTEFSYAATVTVEKMMMIIGTGECRHPFSYTDVDLLIDKLIENPSFERMHLEISKLLKYKAKIHLFEGDIKGGISALKKALNYSNLLNDYIQLARLYWSTGDREKSRETLDTASANAPLDPIRNARWLDQIEKEQAALEKLK
jgi:tetratricopeptide (TPR) repeat protein